LTKHLAVSLPLLLIRELLQERFVFMQELGKHKEGKGAGFHPFILEYMFHLVEVNSTDYSSHHKHRDAHKNKVIPKHNFCLLPLLPVAYCLFQRSEALTPRTENK
jgi:hypothetical protein